MEGQEKRIFIAIVLSIAILVVFSFFIPNPPPPSEEKGAEEKTEEVAPTPYKAEDVKVPTRVGKEEKIITVETPMYTAVFTNQGGAVKRWELKNYWVELKKKHHVVLFDSNKKDVSVYPITVKIEDEGLNRLIQSGLYAVEGGDIHLSEENPEGRLTFTIIDPATRRGIRKTYVFHYDTYRVDVILIPVRLDKPYRVSTGSSFGISTWEETRVTGFVGPVIQVGSKVIKDKVSKITEPIHHEGDIKWIALQDKYFISALIPDGKISKVIVKKRTDKDVQAELEIPADRKFSLKLYAGPKEYKRLRAFNVGLDHSIPFGWFIVWELSVISWLAKGLFHLLQFFHGLTSNYGIAIILLTMVIRVFLAPLSFKSFKSMKEMQRLQPEIKKIQKKYKDDRAAMNKAVMELYKTHKVNPLGGCFPMLLQFPVFIGLYNLLANSIELRHTPFLLWIRDLSTKDPYYILPIIMGITMLVQQKMSPTTADPTQSKIMLFMPIMFTFFFLNFPSGLVLYWMVNNLLTIAQQYVTMKYTK